VTSPTCTLCGSTDLSQSPPRRSRKRGAADSALPAIRLHDDADIGTSTTSVTPTPRQGSPNATGWHEVKVISERLGHANVAITLDTYSHVLPAADEVTAHTLADVILNGS
jgi:integrase